MPVYTLRINGAQHRVDVAADTPLLRVLRDHLRLAGTKYGCGISLCGACTAHMNSNAVLSCFLPVSSIRTAEITTIEGLSENGNYPVQKKL